VPDFPTAAGVLLNPSVGHSFSLREPGLIHTSAMTWGDQLAAKLPFFRGGQLKYGYKGYNL